MPSNRCSDCLGVTIEMVKHGHHRLHQVLLTLLNSCIEHGCIDDHWNYIVFSMIPKQGDLSLPSNWRPIAILPIFYELFSRMLHNRLLPQLDSHQHFDQCGFRPGVRIEDALLVAETLISKTLEYHLPLWMVSLDLKKAFDRVHHNALFDALRGQDVDDPTIALLLEIYSGQRGCVHGSREFDIARGVRQGDVISSLLFNAVIELVFKRWKLRLSHHGWLLTPGSERLTNTRYADDILLYAKSLEELEEMLGLLDDELASVGLELHEGKTKIITSDLSNSISFVEIASKFIEVLGPQKSHKYLDFETKLSFNIVSKLLGMLFTSIDVGCLIETYLFSSAFVCFRLLLHPQCCLDPQCSR